MGLIYLFYVPLTVKGITQSYTKGKTTYKTGKDKITQKILSVKEVIIACGRKIQMERSKLWNIMWRSYIQNQSS
jgi:hypothetical protein